MDMSYITTSLSGLFSIWWTKILIVLTISMIVAHIGAKILTKILKKLASKTETTKDDEIVGKMEGPLIWLVTCGVLYWMIPQFGFIDSYALLAKRLVNTVVVVILAYYVYLVFDLILEVWIGAIVKKSKSDLDDQLLILFQKLGIFIIFCLGLIYILSVWSINIVPLLGGLGIAGLAFAFAFQETLKNLFGGISLILDKNLSIGDVVEVSGGESGKIMDISLRSTRIQTFDNKLVIIPNSIMANGVITNVSKPDRSRRVVIKFGAEYGSDPDYVKKIVMDEITKIKLVEKKDPAPRVVFKDMGESALLFEALYWVKDLDNFVDAKEEGTTRIYERLSKENIGIPFPSRTIYLNDVSKGKTKPYEKKA